MSELIEAPVSICFGRKHLQWGMPGVFDDLSVLGIILVRCVGMAALETFLTSSR